jgi:hypothetical protein
MVVTLAGKRVERLGVRWAGKWVELWVELLAEWWVGWLVVLRVD